MTDSIGASTVNGAARRLMAAVARFVGEAQPTVDVPDLRAKVQVLEQRVATLEATQRAPTGLRNLYDTNFPLLASDLVHPGTRVHTVLDCHGQIQCGMPGCCAIRCRHS
ncbi:hypothetical protein R1A27_28230 [Methylobacterium sp. NMS12]|uniref:hypothetical protein n=1 Tax=Methylobacterium sp. NMS12 TaxID=3079766 RepID=UPI003F88130B